MYPYSSYFAALEAQNSLIRSRLQAQLASKRTSTIQNIRKSRIEAQLKRQKTIKEYLKKQSPQSKYSVDRTPMKLTPIKVKIQQDISPARSKQISKNSNHKQQTEIEDYMRKKDEQMKMEQAQNIRLKTTVKKLEQSATESKKQIQELKQSFSKVVLQMRQMKNQYISEIVSLKSKLEDTKSLISQKSLMIDELASSNKQLKQKVENNKIVTDRHQKFIKQIEKHQQDGSNRQKDSQQHINHDYDFQFITKELQTHKNEIKIIKTKITSFQSSNPQAANPQNQNTIDFSPLGLNQNKISWSHELKSSNLKVESKIVKKLTYFCEFQFSLLQVGFSSSLIRKQCWAIKINSIKDCILVGVCSKNKWKNNNFCSKGVSIDDKNHGANLVGSTGLCLSSYSDELNLQQKSFQFTKGDIIYVQYDPMGEKIRFQRNNGKKTFELPIKPPSDDDTYHPSVGLLDPQDSIQLILPGKQLEQSILSQNSNSAKPSLQQSNSSSLDEFRWSIFLKNPSIVINGNMVKNDDENNSFCLSLMEIGFDSKMSNKQQWKIRVNETYYKLVGIGMCSKKITQQNKFFFDGLFQQKHKVHGLFMICNNGVSLNNLSQQHNHKETTLKFSKGNVIVVVYQPSEHKIRFSIQQCSGFVEMPVGKIDADDCFHPCVGIQGQFEQLQLIKRTDSQNQLLTVLQSQTDLNISNLSTMKQLKWIHPIFKSNLRIDGLTATIEKQSGFGKFAILSTGFTKTMKNIQNWGIKADYFENGQLMFGICMRNKMLASDFIAQNFKIGQLGHGIYLINPKGESFSHSEQEFNVTEKSFIFDEEDVIFVEYDPIQWQIRFRKNKTKSIFSMPIVPPEDQDAYHPFVFFGPGNNQASLILPGLEISSLINLPDPKNKDYIPLGLEKQSIKWSPQLKGQHLKIQEMTVQCLKDIRTKKFSKKYFQYVLLEVGFSANVKQKQCWAIKINKGQQVMKLGICSKKSIVNYNFNDLQVDWSSTGHGFYLIDSCKTCFSHSSKRYNNVNKGLSFSEGDVVFMEYDPIGGKLRFRKNEDTQTENKFEMPVVFPETNDFYHPFVSLSNEKDSVSLILPGKQLL